MILRAKVLLCLLDACLHIATTTRTPAATKTTSIRATRATFALPLPLIMSLSLLVSRLAAAR